MESAEVAAAYARAFFLVCAVGVDRGSVYLMLRERIRRMVREFSVLNTRIIRAPQPRCEYVEYVLYM